MNVAGIRKISILVVDDDAAITRLVAGHLKSELPFPVEVTDFNDPYAASHWLENNCCDILLSDIVMPGLNGDDMLRIAKRRNPWTQVVFMTAHSTWDRIALAIEGGASDYLMKPIDFEELDEVVSHVAARITRWQAALRETLAGAAS
jgi:DNA-binding NtrC family response regulator